MGSLKKAEPALNIFSKEEGGFKIPRLNSSERGEKMGSVSPEVLIWIGVALGAGWAMSSLLSWARANSLLNQAKKKLSTAEEEIKNRKREIELERREELQRIRSEFEKLTEEKRKKLDQLERRLLEREENYEKRFMELKRKEEENLRVREELREEKRRLEEIEKRQREELEKIAGLSTQEAKKILLENIKKEVKEEASLLIKEAEERAKEEANKKARMIISTAIQRCAVDQVAESCVSTVSIPSDEMKGRIIGREGRNIRTFEALTGVDLIVDDTPEAVVISCFDPLRRKIAEIALQRLISDGRIQPARIEEVVEKAKKEVEEVIEEEGKKVMFEMGLLRLAPQVVNLLGRLRFRTSYGQNVLEHSKEVAYLAGIMAAELGEDLSLARRAGLLHDIGKATDHEPEGSHAAIGAEIARKCGESTEVVEAILAHHEEKEATSVLSVLIQAADALSASRPGARREALEAYLKRLEKLEEIAYSFPGVEKSYAIQAGREIRIIVQPTQVDDATALDLCREIAGRIQRELSYPGQIKVTVIRETRAVEYAK